MPIDSLYLCLLGTHPLTVIWYMQVELFHAETEKKEAIPKLRICDFLKKEVQYMQ